MPLFLEDGYAEYSAYHHPRIFEQHGRFFFEDGVQLNMKQIVKMLDYHKEICQRFDIKLNYHKLHNKIKNAKQWKKQITPDMGVAK